MNNELLTKYIGTKMNLKMAEKAKEFTEKGSEIYHGKPESIDDHH